MKLTKQCSICGADITRNKSDFQGPNAFCSKPCMEVHRKTMNKKVWPVKPCAICSTPVSRCPSQMLKNACCSKECTKTYQSQHLSKLNRKLNPDRMTPETREKLRNAHLNTGEGKTYSKTYSRHTHRVVAEQKLGRALLPGEVVHHIDNNRRNNHPDNLQVFKSQADHARHHMLLKYKKHDI